MLDSFFKPRSVAVIGASREQGKIGFSIVNNLIKGGYQGKIYPINPKADEILGCKVYPKVTDIPDCVDLGIVAIPPNFVLDLIEEFAKKEIQSLIVITAGFKEIGGAGAKLEKELKTEVSDEEMISALEKSHQIIKKICEFQIDFIEDYKKIF